MNGFALDHKSCSMFSAEVFNYLVHFLVSDGGDEREFSIVAGRNLLRFEDLPKFPSQVTDCSAVRKFPCKNKRIRVRQHNIDIGILCRVLKLKIALVLPRK